MARRWNRTQSQILVWAGEEPLEILYDAEHIRVPPREEVARVGERSPYRYESAMTRAGVYLPGTLVLTDIFVQTDGGGQVKRFDVAQFCSYLEDSRQDLFERGLEIITDPADAVVVMKDLIPKWEKSQDARARQIVTQELERRKKLEAKGEPVTPGSSEHLVIWAFAHLKNRQTEQRPALSTTDLFNVAAGVFNTPKAIVEAQPMPAGLSPGGELYRQAEEAGLVLNKGEMSGLLMGDPETMTFVRAKIAAKNTAAKNTTEKAAG